MRIAQSVEIAPPPAGHGDAASVHVPAGTRAAPARPASRCRRDRRRPARLSATPLASIVAIWIALRDVRARLRRRADRVVAGLARARASSRGCRRDPAWLAPAASSRWPAWRGSRSALADVLGLRAVRARCSWCRPRSWRSSGLRVAKAAPVPAGVPALRRAGRRVPAADADRLDRGLHRAGRCSVSGVPVYREANHFVIPSGAGRWSRRAAALRYLIASLMVGVALRGLTYRSRWRARWPSSRRRSWFRSSRTGCAPT